MFDLTPRQQQILDFILRHHAAEGFWPSIRDVQAHFRFKSTNAVVGHLRALERKGAIVRAPGQARAYRAVTGDAGRDADREEVVELPVFGSIAAGFPDGVESGDAVGRLQVNLGAFRRNGRRDTFALRVRGESMIDAGINDGDTVVVESRAPREGEIVVALIDGQSTLKHLVRTRENLPYLQSENRTFPSMHPLSELIVQGVATALVRRL
ncbi:MAG TPA: transcriptional repressor LexA [Opitutaceae bacterium]